MRFLKIISQVDPPSDMKDPKVWADAIRRQSWYSMLGLILGLACMIGGIVLFLHGVVGGTSWTTNLRAWKANCQMRRLEAFCSRWASSSYG